MNRPVMSFIVVMKGPVARAGVNLHLFKKERYECTRQGGKKYHNEKGKANGNAEIDIIERQNTKAHCQN